MEIVTGKLSRAQRVVIYGPEGIGKTTFAAQFPSPVFIDTEGGTEHMDVARFARPSCWDDILDAVNSAEVKQFQTLVIDTADWAERLAVAHVCSRFKKESIEDFGYGKGFTFLAEAFNRLLSDLNTLRDSGIHVVFVAHSTVKKMELPDEAGAFDHYELKCSKQISPLLKEWSDALLFINYRVIVQETKEGKSKAVGGKQRMLFADHSAAFDAKNRWGLKDAAPLDFAAIAPHLPAGAVVGKSESHKAAPRKRALPPNCTPVPPAPPAPPVASDAPAKANPDDGCPAQLRTLMELSGVSAAGLREYLEPKGWLAPGAPLSEIREDIYRAILVDENWAKVVEKVKALRRTGKGGAK